MSGVENGGISFGKNQNINFDNFNGIQKKDFDKAGGGALAEPIFAKYDKNKDNVLDESELKTLQDDIREFAKDDTLGKREAKRFFNSLGLEKGHDLKREDLYKFLQTIQADKDSVDRAYTDAETGDTIVQYKPDENNVVNLIRYTNNSDNTHTPKAMAEVFSEDHHRTSFLNDDGTMSIVDVNGNKQVEAQYDENKLLIQTSEIDTQTNEKVTTLYEDDGETIKLKFRQNGSVTEYLDPANGDRVTERVTDKGNGVTETVQFTYNEDGSVTETTVGADEKPISSVTKKDGQEISSVQYTYEDGKTVQTSTKDGVTTEITTTGEGENAQRVKIQRDREGNITGKVNVDENGDPVAYKHKVNQGENWYGIVQAKYGTTDPKTIMEIVHQLKDNAGVKRSSAMMPAEIELPPTITLKNGKEISLVNIDAQFDEINTAQATITVPKVPDDVPSAYPQDKLPAQTVTIPPEQLEVKPENAGKTVTQDDGKVFKYDSEGRVKYVYDSQADLNARNHAVWLQYDDSGNLSVYQLNQCDTNGGWIGAKFYDKDGKLTRFIVNEGADPKIKDKCERSIEYNHDGSVIGFFDNFVYDENGREVSYDKFVPNDNGDFEFLYHWEYKYSSDGKKTRELGYNADGKLDSDELS